MQLELSDAESQRVVSKKKGYGWAIVSIIQRVTADEFGLDAASLAGSGRFKTQTLARHIACFLVRDMTVLSWPEIGLAFGGRDHTTMMAAYDKIERMLRDKQGFRLRVALIKSRVLKQIPLEEEIIPEVADELDRRYGGQN